MSGELRPVSETVRLQERIADLELVVENATAELRAVCNQLTFLEAGQTIEPKLFARNVREGIEIELTIIADLARKER